MGTIPLESNTITLNNDQNAKVQLFTTTDDMCRQEIDGSYLCRIDVNGKIFGRDFLIKDFNKYHYQNFLKKFAREPNYREQWFMDYFSKG
ncbi:hypothetical protein [Halanaerobacter jeridensis]|uniref:Uncharacterized protein n=1 Tax=Halanaerobacter jeridensis TaxID=706427 RepID=A0A938XU01_9FIRM|nr:hypothetical protein [Halanaerobacter jeridensis]MBM7557879.1 hypothetical protein [Halanaerobacter jeridensis]